MYPDRIFCWRLMGCWFVFVLMLFYYCDSFFWTKIRVKLQYGGFQGFGWPSPEVHCLAGSNVVRRAPSLILFPVFRLQTNYLYPFVFFFFISETKGQDWKNDPAKFEKLDFARGSAGNACCRGTCGYKHIDQLHADFGAHTSSNSTKQNLFDGDIYDRNACKI